MQDVLTSFWNGLDASTVSASIIV